MDVNIAASTFLRLMMLMIMDTGAADGCDDDRDAYDNDGYKHDQSRN